MKTCDQAAELLPALAEEMLGTAEAAELRAHIGTCAACAESWKIQELISRHIRETDLADRPDYFWAKQRKHILDEIGLGTSRIVKAQPTRVRRFVLPLAAAAAAALIAVTVLVLRNSDPVPSNGGSMAEKPVEPVKPPDIAKPSPDPVPTMPEETPKDDFATQPESPKQPETPPTPSDSDVVKEPEPEPKKKNEEEPKKKDEGVVQGPKTNDTTPKQPPQPPPVKKDEVAAILPGHARYPIRLAEEQVAIFKPIDSLGVPLVKERETDEQLLAVLKSARARIEDIRLMTAKDPKADVTEMVDAYATAVGEGVGVALFVAKDRTFTRSKAELRAQSILFEKYFTEDLRKGDLLPAIQANATALQSRGRRHAARSGKDADSGAYAAARDTVMLLTNQTSSAGILVLRTRLGFASSVNRYQLGLLEHARAGRVTESQASQKAYEVMVEGMVEMLGLLDAKDAARVCAMARADLNMFLKRFEGFQGPASTRDVIAAAGQFTAGMINEVLGLEQGRPRTPKAPKKDPAPPPGDPPASNPPPPPAPDFGETPPPSPPPPPPPPFGEDP